MRRLLIVLPTMGVLAVTVVPAGAVNGGSDLRKVRGATAQQQRFRRNL